MPNAGTARSGDSSRTRPQFETLEPRLLLTTMMGGDWFVYRGSLGLPILVTLEGRGLVELMAWDGSDVRDVPGMLNGTDVFGGITGSKPLDTIVGNDPWMDLPDVKALAADRAAGIVYAYDNVSRQLCAIDPASGTNMGGIPVTDSLEGTFTYDITAMTTDASGLIYAVGTLVDTDSNPPDLPDPAGPFLITIDPVSGVATRVNPNQVTQPSSGEPIADIAFLGSTLYGIDGANVFVIGVTSGTIQSEAALVDASQSPPGAISDMVGLAEVNNTLYAANSQAVFEVDPGSGQCTPQQGFLSRDDMQDLASDGTVMYGVYSSSDQSMLATITTGTSGGMDIFAVYVADADETTVLSFTEVGEVTQQNQLVPAIPQLVDGEQVSIQPDQVDIHLYNTASTPLTSGGSRNAPAGSGGVLIGGIPAPNQDSPSRYVACDITGVYSPFASPLGVFPGGDVYAGIFTAGPMAKDVGGNLGTSLSAVAADSNGRLFAVDNATGELVKFVYDDPNEPLDTVIGADPWTGLNDAQALGIGPNGEIFAFDNLTGELYELDPFTGEVAASWGQIVDSAEPTFGYTFTALGSDKNGTLYGVGSLVDLDLTDAVVPPSPEGPFLVTIDPAAAQATRVNGDQVIDPAPGGSGQVEDIAFLGNTLYGIDGDSIFQLNTSTGALSNPQVLTDAATLAPISGMFGLTAVRNLMFGVVGDMVYRIDPSNGQCLLVHDTRLLSQADLIDMASDGTKTYGLYQGGPAKLTKIDVFARPKASVKSKDTLVDAAQPAWVYDNVQAMDFDDSGVLWAVSTISSTDPANPAPTGLWLVAVNPATNTAVPVAPVGGEMTLVRSIAWDGTTLYAIGLYQDPGTGQVTGNMLVVLDLTGAVTPIGEVLLDTGGIGAIQGIDFFNGQLYATTGSMLYTIDTATGSATAVNETGMGEMSALTAGGAQLSGYLWSLTYDQGYNLVRIDLNTPALDVGKLMVAGTVAGGVYVSGSLNVMDVGHLWGNVEVDHDLNNLIVRTDVSREPPTSDDDSRPDNSLIRVTGTLRELDIGGTMYGTVWVSGEVNVPDPHSPLVDLNDPFSHPIQELEVKPANNTQYPEALWTTGELMNFNNDSERNAQFIKNESGTIIVWGTLGGPDYGDMRDYWAISLMAGQTVRIDAVGFSDPTEGWVLNPADGVPFLDMDFALGLFDANMRYMGSVGYETVEDEGIGSAGLTQEAYTFTAPAAGVYYLVIGSNDDALLQPDTTTANTWQPLYYSLFIEDLTQETWGNNPLGKALGTANAASLGAIHTQGDYRPSYGGVGTRAGADIEVARGNLGAFEVLGISEATYALVHGNGNLVSFRARQIGTDGPLQNVIAVDNNIGLVESTGTFNYSTITAGAGFSAVNTDAFIQNIRSAEDYRSLSGTGVSATGGIGTVEITGKVWRPPLPPYQAFVINSDDIGDQTAYLDLLHVHGDWGGMDEGIPELAHGANSDIGMVIVEGDIYADYGLYIGPMQPTEFDDGTVSVIQDDGGGQLRIVPGLQYDPNTGEPLVVIDPDTGLSQKVPTRYAYWVVPVQGKTGSVLARLETTGELQLDIPDATDVVDVGQITHTGPGDLRIGGAGTVNVYHIEGTGSWQVLNSTPGDLASGQFDTVQTVDFGGSIGHLKGHLGQWIPGKNAGPDTTQMGWFDRKIHGVHFTGDVNTVRAGGWIGDLLIDGRADTIVANADDYTAPTDFDGVVGVIEADSLGKVYVGDGLLDDGSGDRAEAAIISNNEIDGVYISGAGHVLNGSILAVGTGDPASPPAIGEVIGTDGAVLTANLVAGDTQAYHAFRTSAVLVSGWIDTIKFTGPGAQITGSEIYADWINHIEAGANSNGIEHCRITANDAYVNMPGVGELLAGGPGMYATTVGVNGGRIGIIRGIGPTADLVENTITSTDGLDEISARSIFDNTIYIPVTIKKFAASEDISGNTDVTVGSILELSTGTDFAGNVFNIATELRHARIGGHFLYSELWLRGPTDTRLGTLDVQGNISGLIHSNGNIGQIISREGLISADVITVDPNFNADVGAITTAGGFTGSLEVSGDLGRFTSYATLGPDPATLPDMTPLRFTIAGNLGQLTVKGGKKGSPPVNMYTSLYVGGDLNRLDVDGSLFADLLVSGDVGQLVIDGDMGGVFMLPTPTVLGNVNILGSLGNLTLADGANIVGNLTTGGSIGKIALKDKSKDPAKGNVLGTITSTHGSIDNITLQNGRLGGLNAATSIGKVTLKGDPADPANVTGPIVANGGGIASLTIINGNLLADVTAAGGLLGKFNLSGGDAAAGVTIYASAGVGQFSIKNGDLHADLTTDADLKKLSVLGSDVTGDVTVAGRADNITIAGDLTGNLWAGGGFKSINIRGNVTGAVIASLFDIDKINIGGNVTNSQIIGGWDPATGAVHSADLKTLSVGGDWTASIVALGVDPVDGDFLTDPNIAAPGVSSLGRMTVRGTASALNSRILADTRFGIVPVDLLGVAATVPGVTPPLNPDPAKRFTAGRIVAADGVVITYKGDGQGSYDPATGQLVLQGAGEKHSLTLEYTGPAKTIHVAGDDDLGLTSLTFRGDLLAGDISLHGGVGKLSVGDVAVGANWQLLGGARSITSNGLESVSVYAGPIGSWKLMGDYTRTGGEGLTADAIGNMTIYGDLTASIVTTIAGIKSLTIRGDVDGRQMAAGEQQIVSAGGIDKLSVRSIGADPGMIALLAANPLTGGVHVLGGDLKSLTSNGDVNVAVRVEVGGIGKFQILNGTYGNPAVDTAVRSLTGIGTFSVRGGDAYGIISTGGNLKSLTLTDPGDQAVLFGRVRAGDGIGKVKVDRMDGAILASATDVGTVAITYDMSHSTIVAGLDPGDAGYDPAHGGELANVHLDGRTTPAWRTPLNADTVGGGDIKQVTIGGSMIASTIAAAVGAGQDGWFGTPDDQVRGTGFVQRVRVGGSLRGSANPDEHYGIFAASAMPQYTAQPMQPLDHNFTIATQAYGVGSPRIVDVQFLADRIIVFFDHDIDFSTINTAIQDPNRPTTFDLVVSHNSTFGPGEPDDVSISDTIPHSLSYDQVSHSVTLALDPSIGTFLSLNKGTNFMLTIDADLVTDRRGNLLDGEYTDTFPTGDGVPGGDFAFRFIHHDAGDSPATAIDLTAGVPILRMNKVLDINARIGDNAPRPADQDRDYYSLEVHEGDLLYYTCSGADVSHTGPTDPSVSGSGYRVNADGTVLLEVTGAPGPYTLSVLLFNDGNSNFNFDDPTQTPTPVVWVGDRALVDPLSDTIVGEITGPDDFDLYDLGPLPAFTEIHIAVDTKLIGSSLDPKLAVFNSNGDLVGNIVFSHALTGWFDMGKIDTSVTLETTVLTPADDTYYVAVAGMRSTADDFRQADLGQYRLEITRNPGSAPVFLPQVVYLNFNGGVADFVTEVFGDSYEGRVVETYQRPLSAATYGFSADDTQALINEIVNTVENIYAGFGNISFTTVRPMGGLYSTVFIGDNLAPDRSTLGIAEHVDTNNSDLSDQAVIFGGELAWQYSADNGYTLAEVGRAIGNSAAHELGHILGLNHVNVSAGPDTWVMSYPGDDSVPMVFTTHERLMNDANEEFHIGYQNSVMSLWSIQ